MISASTPLLRRDLTKNVTVRFEEDKLNHSGHDHANCDDSIVTDSSLEENSIFNKINSSDTRVRRLNTISQGFTSIGTFNSNKKKSSIDIEVNFQIKDFLVKVYEDKEHQHNLLFEFKDLQTQLFLEHQFKDVSVDLTIHTIELRLVEDEQPFDDLFAKILSCPL